MLDQAEIDAVRADWGLGDESTVSPYASVEQRPQRATGPGPDGPPVVAGATFSHAPGPTGWRSADELLAAVHAAYPEGGMAVEVEVAPDGSIYRWVPDGMVDQPFGDQTGTLITPLKDLRVPVALSQGVAQQASRNGTRTDWFNGWTWVTRGVKPERDAAVLAQRYLVEGHDPNVRIRYEPASPAEQTRYRAQVAALVANTGVALSPLPETAPSRRPPGRPRKAAQAAGPDTEE
jgi:hypothetical protein